MARRTAYLVPRSRPEGFYRRVEDETVLRQICAVTNSRASYGYRRVWAMVNRACRTGYNRKRIRRERVALGARHAEPGRVPDGASI